LISKKTEAKSIAGNGHDIVCILV